MSQIEAVLKVVIYLGVSMFFILSSPLSRLPNTPLLFLEGVKGAPGLIHMDKTVMSTCKLAPVGSRKVVRLSSATSLLGGVRVWSQVVDSPVQGLGGREHLLMEKKRLSQLGKGSKKN